VQLRELLRPPHPEGGPGTRARAFLELGWDRARRLVRLTIPRAARAAVEGVRRRPLVSATVAAAVLALLGLAGWSIWSQGRAAARARDLLAGNKPAEARAVVEEALEHRTEDPELLLLRAHSLQHAGKYGEAVEAYAAARARGPLDATAHENLVADLGRERSLADRAARVLRDEGARAAPAVLHAATTATGPQRLRALTLARDLGAEDQIDRVAAWSALLGDTDCELRRAAARRLGELGDPAALPALRKAAQAQVKTETKMLFGSKTKIVPACGAPDADAAARRIEAARAPSR